MKVTIARVRDVLTLALGAGGLTRELFLATTPNMARVWVSIGLVLGPAVMLAWWSARAGIPPQSGAQSQPSDSSSRSLPS